MIFHVTYKPCVLCVAVFEGEQIQHLDKVTTMDNTGNDEDLSAKQDDFVLRRLFKSSGKCVGSCSIPYIQQFRAYKNEKTLFI